MSVVYRICRDDKESFLCFESLGSANRVAGYLGHEVVSENVVPIKSDEIENYLGIKWTAWIDWDLTKRGSMTNIKTMVFKPKKVFMVGLENNVYFDKENEHFAVGVDVIKQKDERFEEVDLRALLNKLRIMANEEF